MVAEINEKFESILREYIVVGGMPEVVQTFVDTKDFNEVRLIQEKILATYDDDIALHAKGAEKVKVRVYYESLPRQLARENKKFKYSEVENRGNAKGGIYENVISELLVKRGYNLNYYKTQNSTIELEFVIEKNSGVVPVEVKEFRGTPADTDYGTD